MPPASVSGSIVNPLPATKSGSHVGSADLLSHLMAGVLQVYTRVAMADGRAWSAQTPQDSESSCQIFEKPFVPISES